MEKNKQKNRFQVNGDYKPYEVVDSINWILQKSFGIQIECLTPDDSDGETLEYEISIIKNK